MDSELVNESQSQRSGTELELPALSTSDEYFNSTKQMARADSSSVIPTFTHSEAMMTAKDMLSGLIMNDHMLRDLDPQVTLEEVNSMIALEYGQAMVVNIRRQDNEIISVVVTHNAKVGELKQAFRRQFTLRQSRRGIRTHVNWSYVWKRHLLIFEKEKLLDDNRTLKSYGIHNKDTITFIKRLKEK